MLGCERRRTLVVDSGTGTTAVGVALGVAALGLPWHVVGVMLAGDKDDYVGYQRTMLAAVRDTPPASAEAARAARVAQQQELPLSWVPRVAPRRFGKVLPGEPGACRDVARATGVLLDPIYTLAGWEVRVCAQTSRATVYMTERRLVNISGAGFLQSLLLCNTLSRPHDERRTALGGGAGGHGAGDAASG